jgi:hypothetical protein
MAPNFFFFTSFFIVGAIMAHSAKEFMCELASGGHVVSPYYGRFAVTAGCTAHTIFFYSFLINLGPRINI